jgi:hypothetical protein
MRKGMNNYLAGIMLSLLVIAVVIVLYALSKDGFSIFQGVIQKLKTFLGV